MSRTFYIFPSLILFIFFGMRLTLFFDLPLQNHIHILREGAIALLSKIFNFFDHFSIKRQTYILLQRSITFTQLKSPYGNYT